MESGLGSGLAALIPPKSKKTNWTLPEKGSGKESVFLIEIEKIKPNPYQPRSDFDKDSLRELAESIREFGILQPLIVSKEEKSFPGGSRVEYQLVAGERRLRAAKLAGFAQVPVIIRKPDAMRKLEVSLVENIQRANLNAIERARAFNRLMEEFSVTQTDIANRLGQSREAVSNTLRLLELPEDIQNFLKDEKISEGHARAIISVEGDENKRSIVERILAETLSVRTVEELARKLRRDERKEEDPAMTRLERELKKVFGEEYVRVSSSRDGAKVVITFPEKKDFEMFVKKVKN